MSSIAAAFHWQPPKKAERPGCAPPHRRSLAVRAGAWLFALIWIAVLLACPVSLVAQSPNPTWLSASPSVITMPGSITYCAGNGANMTVDLQYYWNGGFYEADSDVTFGWNGCVLAFQVVANRVFAWTLE